MSTTPKAPRKNNKKKIAAVVTAGVLTAALAGGGALQSLFTSITGNQFNASVPGPDTEMQGALLKLDGQAMVHTFAPDRLGQQTQASNWYLENRGTTAAPFDGKFELVGHIDATLAQNLLVQYGQVNAQGTIVSWHDGGTLADPATFGDALGISPQIAGLDRVQIPVRILLEDPSELEGLEGDELQVNATFTVSYLSPDAS